MSIINTLDRFKNFNDISTYITWGSPMTTHIDDTTIHFTKEQIQSVPSGTLPFNYIDSDGNIQAKFSESGFFVSDRYYWDDLRVPLESSKAGGAKEPDFGKCVDDNNGSQGVYCFKFDPNLEQELFFSIQIPHRYKEGSDIHPHIHWTPSSSGNAYVIWGLEYSWANINEPWPYTTTIKASGLGHAEQNHSVLELGTINGSGKNLSSMLMCRLFRDATNDDYEYDANIIEFDLHYQADSHGSWQEYKKF